MALCLSGFLWSDKPHLQDNYLTNHEIRVTHKRRADIKIHLPNQTILDGGRRNPNMVNYDK